jgi:aminoglycoside phosphotransferase (APT) family kinase protein
MTKTGGEQMKEPTMEELTELANLFEAWRRAFEEDTGKNADTDRVAFSAWLKKNRPLRKLDG